MKTDFANAPTPTLFDLFLTNVDEVASIDQKRYVRQICEAVGASIQRKVRYRMTDQAGQHLIGDDVVSVPGFVVFAEASDEVSFADDKRALHDTWWTGGGMEQVTPYRVAKTPRHALDHELEFGADVEAFVVNTLQLTFVKPDAWTKREDRVKALAQLEADRKQRREERAAKKAKATLEAAKAAATAAGVELVTVEATNSSSAADVAQAA
jgi:hypothetical protein